MTFFLFYGNPVVNIVHSDYFAYEKHIKTKHMQNMQNGHQK